MSEHRLIYADELYDTLANKLTWLMRYGDDVYLEAGKDIREAIDEQSTAYDIDKVIKQLEDYTIEFEAFGICSDYVELTHAIEIVKGGTK